MNILIYDKFSFLFGSAWAQDNFQLKIASWKFSSRSQENSSEKELVSWKFKGKLLKPKSNSTDLKQLASSFVVSN